MNVRPVILFEDNHCIAVAKPAGLLTQGVPPATATLETLVKDYLRAQYGKKGRIYLGIPHRLDRPVSGVVLFARQTKSAQRLAEQFQARQVQKIYWAAVEGNVDPPEGVWVDWLLKVADESRSVQATPETEGAKHALLRYRKLAALPTGILLELRPETGRMHQLRVQAALRGHPILGDAQYGSQVKFGPEVQLARDRVIGLHGRSLTFLHPIRYQPITVTAPLPEHWRSLLIPPDVYTWETAIPCAEDSP
jgi:23S rRNA pseudouridine1911/1915/1917 synthase